MKIATWNVNSVLARTDNVASWLETARPDVACLQETKCIDDRFPCLEFENKGYGSALFGQATYNGVAVLSRGPIEVLRRGLPDDTEDAQRRLLDIRTQGVRIINVYAPNGEKVGSNKYSFKLAWYGRLRQYLDTYCQTDEPLILCGDFNVAPDERDVYDPRVWEGRILFSIPEREALGRIVSWGLVDLFRAHHAEPGLFTWWDYRAGAFRRNQGLRIDHLLATAPLAERCTGVEIDRQVRAKERPSDHAPVIAEFRE
jgi:exodeoxyribonuclease III